MRYSVWSRGEHIGDTDLDFRGIGIARCRSGYFLPNSRGVELMPRIACATSSMRAFTHRNLTDGEGECLLHPDYVGSSMFADVAQYLQRAKLFEFELRDAHNVLIPTVELGLQDTNPSNDDIASDDNDLDPILSDELEREINGGHEQNREQREAHRIKMNQEKYSGIDHQEWNKEMLALAKLEAEFDGESFGTELDVSSPIARNEVDEQHGLSWNPNLSAIAESPRYQIHVVLENAEELHE